jgi:hypothetical protein
MTAGERDKKMDEVATAAATAFRRKYQSATKEQIEASPYPETYLQHTIPYLTVRTLHRQEKALQSLEADSRWIKFLTVVLVTIRNTGKTPAMKVSIVPVVEPRTDGSPPDFEKMVEETAAGRHGSGPYGIISDAVVPPGATSSATITASKGPLTPPALDALKGQQ